MTFRKAWFVGLVLIFLAALPWQSAWQAFRFNRIARQVLAALLVAPAKMAEAQASLAGMTASNCRALWLQGQIYAQASDTLRQDQFRHAAMTCDPAYVPILALYAPGRRDWAEEAARLYPQSAEAWFWLARTHLQEAAGGPILIDEADRLPVIALYQKGLALAPDSGLRWCQLGRFLKPLDVGAALDANAQCCANGDPGSNGCYGAGLISEEQGDLENAVRYYHRSRWEGARQRADALEQQLKLTPAP